MTRSWNTTSGCITKTIMINTALGRFYLYSEERSTRDIREGLRVAAVGHRAIICKKKKWGLLRGIGMGGIINIVDCGILRDECRWPG